MSDIEQHLDLLNRGLKRIKEKNNTAWEPEQIIDLCRKGGSFLFVVEEGFYILTPAVSAYTGDRFVKIEAAYSDCSPTGECLIEKYIPEIECRAREIGATHVVFDSPRRGYERIPAVEVSTVVYRKEVRCAG